MLATLTLSLDSSSTVKEALDRSAVVRMLLSKQIRCEKRINRMEEIKSVSHRSGSGFALVDEDAKALMHSPYLMFNAYILKYNC